MKPSGIILELNGDRAVILTDQGAFVEKKRTPGMAVGQQVLIVESESRALAGLWRKRAVALAAVACSALIVTLCLLQFLSRNRVFAYIDLDINSSVEFAIDRENRVLEASPLNEDAKTLLAGLDAVNRPLDAAISDMIAKMEREGLLPGGQETIILVSASLNSKDENETESKQLETLLGDIKTGIETAGGQDIVCEVLSVAPPVKQAAAKNGLSMARQEAYERAQESGIALTVEEIREKPVSELLKDVSSGSGASSGNTAGNEQPDVIDEPTTAPAMGQSTAKPTPKPTDRVSSTPTPAIGAHPTPTPTPTQNATPDLSGSIRPGKTPSPSPKGVVGNSG
ncbi:MAG: anti-sigma factor domain-containing protein [Bacillota bacterium]